MKNEAGMKSQTIKPDSSEGGNLYTRRDVLKGALVAGSAGFIGLNAPFVFGASPASAGSIGLSSAVMAGAVAVTAEKRPVTIEDCLRYVRIQQTYSPTDPTVVFSPDGRWFASQVWHGNLEKNLNEYTLLLFDAEHLDQPAKQVLTIDFGYEEEDQHARALKQFAFLSENRLAALGRFNNKPRQVAIIDLKSGQWKTLTSSQTGVLSFAISPDGNSFVYAEHAPADETRRAALFQNGFSLLDPMAIDNAMISQIAVGSWFKPVIQYFLISGSGSTPRKIFENAGGATPNFFISPDGSKAIVDVYSTPDSKKPFIGLIDMSSGSVEPLVRGSSPASGRALWAADGKSVVIYEAQFTGGDAVLHSIDLASRKVITSKLGAGGEWDMLGWNAAGDGVLFCRGGYPRVGKPEHTLGEVKLTSGGWQPITAFNKAESKYALNARYNSSTNGRLIGGVKDSLADPPELAVYDVASKTTHVLTNLNPEISEMSLGEVSRITWDTQFDKGTSFGYLMKPVGYVKGKRYPLIIQFKDEGYYPEDNSYLFDCAEQHSGGAMQVWANEGFMVLYTPSPLSLRAVIETPKEDEHITVHIDAVIDLLDSQGLIDRNKCAISGWSRSGWWSEVVVTHSKHRFAAVSNIDNVEYNMNQYTMWAPNIPPHEVAHWAGVVPWGPNSEGWAKQAIDFKYDKAQTPRLSEIHGMQYGNISHYAELISAHKTAKIPHEIYLYPDGPHNLKSPLHRLHSLSTHNDWYRFWLQDGYEDPSPEKKAQYERWWKMRDEWPAWKSLRG